MAVHRRGPLILLVVLVALLALSRGGSASCSADRPTPAVALADADAVFRGRVMAIGSDPLYIPVLGRSFPEGGGRRVAFEVRRYWKGQIHGPEIVLMSWSTSTDYEFEAGREYLVYAHRRDPNHRGAPGAPLNATHCGLTRPIAGAAADLRALGPGRTPHPRANGDAPVVRLVVPAIGAVLVLILAVPAIRRRSV